MAKRLPLPKRFPAAVTEPAHERLRALDAVFREFIAGHGAPGPGHGAR